MITKTVSGRRLGRQPRIWLKWTKKNGPIAVHDSNERRYVLMSYDDYLRLFEQQDQSATPPPNDTQPAK